MYICDIHAIYVLFIYRALIVKFVEVTRLRVVGVIRHVVSVFLQPPRPLLTARMRLCVRERERERECVCVCVRARA